MMTATFTRRILPGFGLSLGTSLFFTCLIILLPLSGLALEISQMSLTRNWQIITEPRLMSAYKITLIAAAIAALFNAVFGLLMAWILTRYCFPCRVILDGLVDLPFALATVVAGLMLADLFSPAGWCGKLLAEIGIHITYSSMGIIVAMAFTSIPYVIRAVQPVLEGLEPEFEEVAKTIGAHRLQRFWRIILLGLAPALMSGSAISFARSLGEFGAVIFIAGNIAWKSEVISFLIFVREQEFDFPAASAIASVVMVFSLGVLFTVNVLQSRYGQRLGAQK